MGNMKVRTNYGAAPAAVRPHFKIVRESHPLLHHWFWHRPYHGTAIIKQAVESFLSVHGEESFDALLAAMCEMAVTDQVGPMPAAEESAPPGHVHATAESDSQPGPQPLPAADAGSMGPRPALTQPPQAVEQLPPASAPVMAQSDDEEERASVPSPPSQESLDAMRALLRSRLLRNEVVAR